MQLRLSRSLAAWSAVLPLLVVPAPWRRSRPTPRLPRYMGGSMDVTWARVRVEQLVALREQGPSPTEIDDD